MLRTIALFEERETRDELGIGTVRDVFSDSMFPGTSTIQTRLRYFLFVPWIYRALEESRVDAEHVARRARRDEVALIEALVESDETVGIIGQRSRGALKRLPSSIYWAGLARWHICLFPGSQDQYHRQFDAIRRMRRERDVPDDEGVEADPLDVWHPQLPPAPREWPDDASFTLTQEEADFLRGRIAHACKGSVLAWCAVHGRPSASSKVWHLPDLGAMTATLQREVDLARRFSAFTHGAALLYNLSLAELRDRDDLRDSYRAALDGWARADERGELLSFRLDELWEYVATRGATVPGATRAFLSSWRDVVAAEGPAGVASSERARALVRTRERALKGARSRFANRRALDQWSGSSGSAALDYRWPTARVLLDDLHSAGQEVA